MNRYSNISWVKNKIEAEYWYQELLNFIQECHEAVADLYNPDEFKEFLREVDEMIQRRFKFGSVAQAMLGAVMIRRFLFECHPEIDVSKKEVLK